MQSTNQPKPTESKDAPTSAKLQEVFSLNFDQAHPDEIDNDIRKGVRVSGTNMWVLMFAIAIASIGLNVNSTAVIIGAMLISPLMSPIVGIGYGAAVSDIKLIRLSIRNMSIFVLISLLTATLYFSITPLEQAHSELLARTTPTLWDVLIAFFGGSAGIIALTRKEISNVTPGVAIATALMPPLCTAGYALAHANWDYFFGAFYLFTINCVFIAFATLLFSKLLKLPRRGLVTETTRRIHRTVITLAILIVMIPSGFLATKLVQQELFDTKVKHAIHEVQQENNFYILRSQSDFKNQSVGLIINGVGNGQHITEQLTKSLNRAGISEPNVTVLYAGGDGQSNLNQNIHALEQKLEQLQNSQNKSIEKETKTTQQTQMSHTLEQAVIQEIVAQYPNAQQVQILHGVQWQQAKATTPNESTPITTGETTSSTKTNRLDTSFQPNTLIIVSSTENISTVEQQRLQAWLKQRLQNNHLEFKFIKLN